jgi:hypothetical protein
MAGRCSGPDARHRRLTPPGTPPVELKSRPNRESHLTAAQAGCLHLTSFRSWSSRTIR